MEPKIIINGHRVSAGAAMTLRVALENFAMFLSEPNCLGKDENGLEMRDGYIRQLHEIRKVMYPENHLTEERK